jgi:His-Xaa-Ser system protein HxsD
MTITIDLSIYSLDLVLRTCHVFSSRCYVNPHTVANGRIAVEFVARDEKDSLRDLAGAFSNALLDSHLRAVITNETRTIRELLVAQAFCEADLLDRRDIESDEHADPRGIAG